MIALAGQDILDAIGIPPASQTDMDWADGCAAATNSYVNALPVAKDLAHADDVLQAGKMLGVSMYHRRPAGAVSPDADMSAAAAVDNTVARLLRIGYYQKPVVA